jgi:hypothetical protein
MTITSHDSLSTCRDSPGNVARSPTRARSAMGCAIRRITFASCYVYSPCGSGAACERSRLLRAMLKSGDTRFIVKYAFRVHQQVVDESPLAGFVCPDHILVPVPGSARSATGRITVAEHLAMAMVEAGLGGGLWNGLRRIWPVRKSATAPRRSRPTVANHYDSFAIGAATALPPRVVLVDDVVTKGRTLLAAAARLQEAFPTAEIRAFAMLRTMGLVQGVDHLLDPCVGEIRWSAGDAHRTP